MFYMPNTKMLFGDAKVSCDGKSFLTMFYSLRGLDLLTIFDSH
jgi:hypothetical protein